MMKILTSGLAGLVIALTCPAGHAGLISVTCKDKAGILSYTQDYSWTNQRGIRMRLISSGKTFEFPYESAERPMGSVSVTVWIAEDGSYLEDRDLTASPDPKKRFAIFYDAATGRTKATLVICNNKFDDSPEEP